jgi:hypothetical protein
MELSMELSSLSPELTEGKGDILHWQVTPTLSGYYNTVIVNSMQHS